MKRSGELELRERGAKVLLRLRVRPGGRCDRIVGVHGGALKCRVSAAPERGKANQAALRLLSRFLQCPQRSIEIIAGSTSPDKTVAISDLDAEGLRIRIARALASPEQGE